MTLEVATTTASEQHKFDLKNCGTPPPPLFFFKKQIYNNLPNLK